MFFTIDGVVYGVTDVHVHQGYSNSLVGTDQGHDIAVLRLNREVVGVQPSPIYRGQLNVGQSLTLVGYGAHPGDDSFGTKRTGTTPIDGVTPNLITWTYDGAHETTTVPGDSGSPQFVQTETGEFAVASVAS